MSQCCFQHVDGEFTLCNCMIAKSKLVKFALIFLVVRINFTGTNSIIYDQLSGDKIFAGATISTIRDKSTKFCM